MISVCMPNAVRAQAERKLRERELGLAARRAELEARAEADTARDATLEAALLRLHAAEAELARCGALGRGWGSQLETRVRTELRARGLGLR